MKDPNTVLTNYLSDMAAVEEHIFEATERQLKTENLKRYPEAVAVLQTLNQTLQRHLDTIHREIESHGKGDVKEMVKKAVTGALGFIAGIYDKIRTDEASRMIRDTYTATNLAAISYHMLHTTALGLKEQRVADMAINHLRELTPILVELSQVVCSVVARELANEGKVFDGTVGDKAIENTQEAWSSSVTGQTVS